MKVRPVVVKDIQQLISDKYPGVVLESPVQGWVYLEDYEQGIKAHQEMIQVHTTAQDDRWLGVCYFQLFDDLKAIELFFRAIARGDQAARINLAFAFLFVERTEQIPAELEKVDYDGLSLYDKVHYHRVTSYYQENQGNLQSALDNAETAWRLVQGIAELPIIATQTLNQLGTLFGRLGRANRSLWFFEQSLKLFPSDIEKTKTVLNKAWVLNLLGRHDEAVSELHAITGQSLPQSIAAMRSVILGDAAWGNKNLSSAEEYYESGIATALASSTIFEEFIARLSLAAIQGSQGLISTASEHLARAKVLVTDRSDELAHRLRDILLAYWAEECTVEQTRDGLEDLAQAFGKMGLLQEQGWVQLHIAEMYRQQEDEEGIKKQLDVLQKLATILQNNAFLSREWTLVPKLRELALKTHPKIAGQSPDLLEVYTMGEEKLILNGKIVNIRLRRGVEVLAYFLQNERVSLKKMLLDVFADEEPKAARNYFHQFKHELHERVPSLQLEYSPDERLYTLKSEADILWDVAELRAGRKLGALGIFLPSSGSEWALLTEHELEPLKDKNEVFPTPQVLT